MKRVIFLGIAVLSALPASALADQPTKKECIEANAQAQKQENDGKLRAAQTSLQLCSQTACPSVVRNDCTQLLGELIKRLPSLVFEAHNAAGVDLTAVRVSIDGQPLAEALDGTAIPVDPGEHTFRFESAHLAPVTTKLVIREGDRARRERINFAAAAPAVPPPPPPPPMSNVPPPPQTPLEVPPAEPTPERTTSPLRYVGLATAGVGVVGVGLGVIFGLKAKSKNDDSKTDPNGAGCNADDFCGPTGKQLRSDAQSAATISTVGFIAGGVLLATGIGMIIFAPSGTKTATITPMIGYGTGGALLQGWF